MAGLISVVVCTYNRSGLLAGAVQSLCEQTLDAALYEVIVVDNNSTDHTAAVVAQAQQGRPNVRYCRETAQGLSHARNRGWREAKGAYVGYLDDDAKAPREWLSVAGEIIERQAPDVFGGPVYPFYLAPKPAWFKDAYGSITLGDAARELAPGEYLAGGNLFLRRPLLEEMGGFESGFGMTGSRIVYGEETILQARLRRRAQAAKVFYDPRLYIYHLAGQRKMRLGWKARSSFASGRDYQRLLAETGDATELEMCAGSRLKMFCDFVRALRQCAVSATIGAAKRDRRQYPSARNHFFEQVCPQIWGAGQLYARLWRMVRGN